MSDPCDKNADEMDAADEDDEVEDEIPTAAAPFLRWVGSKRRYAASLAARCEAAKAPEGRYIEPFLGSGAVALAMEPGTPMLLADRSEPLGYLWWHIQREPEAVAEYAASFGIGIGEGWNTEEGYATARFDHNSEPPSAEDYRPSARFLWIMCACFNGIYRENKLGYFNCPWGHRKRVSAPTPAALRTVADHVINATVLPGWDFEDVMAEAADGDVVFSDPPYDGDATAFTSYVKTPFGAPEQERLRDTSERARDRGATVIMTNADTPRIRELYRGWEFDEVIEHRPVAASPRARLPARCLVVTSRRRR